jgi:hypothetical protein
MAKDVEYFLMNLLAIWKVSIQFICLFIDQIFVILVGFFFFLVLYIFWKLVPCYLEKIFSHSVDCLFTLLIVSIAR